MIKYLRQLVDERNALTGLMQTTADRAADEQRDLSDTEQQSLRDYQARCGELDRQIGEYNDQAASQRSWARLQDELRANDDEPVATGRVTAQQRSADAAPDWGQVFTDSEAFASYSGRGTSGTVKVAFDTRASITTGEFVIPPAIYTPPTPAKSSPLLSVIGHERVSSGAVDYLYWPPPDPTAPVVAEGGLKPEANIVATPLSAVLQTYAHWKGITRQALEDVPRLQSIVSGKLQNGLTLALEAAAAAALAADANIPPVAADATTGLLGGLRVGLAEVQSNGYSPNAALLNPADWASIDLALLAGTLNGPVTNNSAFGLRLIASSSVPVGTAYVGSFSDGVTLFDRGDASVYMTDSHADFFIRNTLVILAETRGVVTVTEPLALVKVTVPAGP
jgi:HK97 family phage major capsid protein